MKHSPHVRLGKRDVKLTAPSHVPGVQQGNEGPGGKDSPERRSTGVAPNRHKPMLPTMPNLTPC